MKMPKNFDKIHLKRFTTATGKEYNMNIEAGELVWAFRQPDTTKYCLAVIFDWARETYEVKRARNGHGKLWDKTLHEGNININAMRSMDEFVDWFSKVITVFEYDYK